MALFTIEWVKNVSGADKYQTEVLPEGASESFKKGTPVAYDLSENGVVELSLSSGEQNTVGMYGIALEDATGTTASPLEILVPQPGDVFSAMIGSDEDTLVAPDIDNYGELGELVRFSTSASDADSVSADGSEYGIHEGAGGSDSVKIISIDPRDVQRRGYELPVTSSQTYQAGDRVLFKFVNTDTTGQQA